MGTTLVETEDKVATALGFYQSHLIEKGETFVAPVSFTAKWFVSKADLASGEIAAEDPRFLDRAAKDIIAELPNKTSAEITALIAEEQAGKARKGLLAIMTDTVANRVGEIEKTEENPFA